MRKTLFFILLAAFYLPAGAQTPPPDAQPPSPDAQAFARLPADLRAMLSHLPPGEALQKVEFARQNLIALGVPSPSPGQLRGTVARVILSSPEAYSVEGASAGATTFPPLSPLVSPHTPQR
jgi:hypothetical protein